jgi:hypothetical protein
MKWLIQLIEQLAAQGVLNELVAKIGSKDVQAFIDGAFTGTFPTVKITVFGIHITFTNADIQTFLTDVKTKNWQDMMAHAVASLDTAA